MIIFQQLFQKFVQKKLKQFIHISALGTEKAKDSNMLKVN